MRNGGWGILLVVLVAGIVYWLMSGKVALAGLLGGVNNPTAQAGLADNLLWNDTAPTPGADVTIPPVSYSDPYADGTLSLPTFDPVLTNG